MLGKDDLVEDSYTLTRKDQDCPGNTGHLFDVSYKLWKNNPTTRKPITFFYFYDVENEKAGIHVISASHWKLNGCWLLEAEFYFIYLVLLLLLGNHVS